MAKDKIRVGIIGTRLMLDSGVLHTCTGLKHLDIKRLFPKTPHRSRPREKACKNNLLRQT